MSFAARLKEARLRSGKSLQEVADAIGASKAHLWDLEMGKSKNPSIDLLRKLSDYLNVSITRLVGEEDAGADESLKVMFRQIQELDPKDRELLKAIIDARKKQKDTDESADRSDGAS
jgi:transcriptional regulator with XRE-family HTH domain